MFESPYGAEIDPDSIQGMIDSLFPTELRSQFHFTSPFLYPSNLSSPFLSVDFNSPISPIGVEVRHKRPKDGKQDLDASLDYRIVNVLEVSDTDREKFLKAVEGRTSEFRDYLLFNVASSSFALHAALEDTEEALQIICDATHVSMDTQHLEAMVSFSLAYSTLAKILEVSQIPKEEKDALLAAYLDKHLIRYEQSVRPRPLPPAQSPDIPFKPSPSPNLSRRIKGST